MINSPLPPNLSLAKKLNRWAWIVSGFIFVLVVSMQRIHFDTNIDFSFLPPFYSFLNALTAIILLCGLYLIKNGRVLQHRRAMTTALVTSVCFLVCYIVYHTTTVETRFCQEGTIRYVYFFFLITAGILPFILFTYIRAYTNQFDKHVRLAKWVFPFWLYVAVTGPVLYLMLRPCY